MSNDKYKLIKVKPLSGIGGAEIQGVDLSQPLDDSTCVEIKRAFSEYLVIGFRNQDISPEQQCAFARHWGPLTRHPFVKTMPDHPYVAAVIRFADDTAANFGGVWHADTTMIEKPPLGTTLYAREVPPYGGDTLFTNLYLAYERLSPGMKKLADSLVVMHSAAKGYDPNRGASDPKKSNVMQSGITFEITDDVTKEMPHPLVRINPDTGRKALWVAGDYCLRFQDMTEEESQPLLNFFQQHAIHANFTFRWRWEKGSLLFWDNRVTNHFAINDYHGFYREMHRVTVEGEIPFGPALPAQNDHATARSAAI